MRQSILESLPTASRTLPSQKPNKKANPEKGLAKKEGGTN